MPEGGSATERTTETATASATGNGPETPTALAAENGSTSATTSAEANRTLVVADAETNESLLDVPVTDGDELTLAYTHSVEKTDVEDVYEIDGTELQMDRTVFSSYGAGLPSEAAVNRTDDGFVVSVDRSYDRVYVAPGSIAGHVLHVGGECYDLVDRSDGSTVVLFVEERAVESAAAPSGEAIGTSGVSIDPSGESVGTSEECEERP